MSHEVLALALAAYCLAFALWPSNLNPDRSNP